MQKRAEPFTLEPRPVDWLPGYSLTGYPTLDPSATMKRSPGLIGAGAHNIASGIMPLVLALGARFAKAPASADSVNAAPAAAASGQTAFSAPRWRPRRNSASRMVV